MNYSKDIKTRIIKYFSDIQRVNSILSRLEAPDSEHERAIRCILYLSDSDYDSLESWVETANIDIRNVYYLAEYDNRDERKWNFNLPFDKQSAYQFRNK